jgi:hypothetical protein
MKGISLLFIFAIVGIPLVRKIGEVNTILNPLPSKSIFIINL